MPANAVRCGTFDIVALFGSPRWHAAHTGRWPRGDALPSSDDVTGLTIGEARLAVSWVRCEGSRSVPPLHYAVPSILDGNASIEGTGQTAVNDVIKKLKDQAATLGPNGVLVGKTGQQYAGSINGASDSSWGAFLGSSAATHTKTARAGDLRRSQCTGAGAAQTAAGNGAGPAVSASWPQPMTPRYSATKPTDPADTGPIARSSWLRMPALDAVRSIVANRIRCP